MKRWTRSGKAVNVTDNGKPLWILHPADGSGEEEERRSATNELLDEVLRARPSKISAVGVLEESRR